MATVRLGINGGTGRIYSGPTLLGLDRGYFQQQGIDVEVVESGGRRGSIPMLSAGELDVSPQGLSLEFIQAWDPDRPLVMAADHGTAGGGTGGLVARPELIKSGRLRDFADLRGLRIGLSPIRGDHDWKTFGTALQKGGLSFDDVQVVICDFGEGRHQALANGDLDLSTVGRPSSIAEAQEAGTFVVWKRTSEVEPGDRQGRTVVFSHPFWSDRPDDARRYLAAHLQGVREYHNAFVHGAGREGVIDALARQSGEKRETVAKLTPGVFNPDGYINVPSVKEELGWYEGERLLPHPVPIDRVVNHELLDGALAALGKYQPPKAG